MAFVNVKPAATGHSNHQFNPVTVASIDYAQLLATRCIEVNPGDHFKNVACNSFVRLAPTIFPAFGRTSYHSAAFFVPEEQLVETSKAFHSGMSTYKGHSVVMPCIHSWQINHMFADPDFHITTALATVVGRTKDPQTDTTNIPASEWDYDFIDPGTHITDGVVYFYYKLTHLGKLYYKVLKSLGFDWKSYPSIVTTSYTVDQIRDMEDFTPNVLPLLAYVKIYADMFLNGHTYNDNVIVSYLRDIHEVRSIVSSSFVTLYSASTGEVHPELVERFLNFCVVPHKRNYYLEAWNTPNSPTGVSPDSEMIDVNSDGPVSPYNPSYNNAFQKVVNYASTPTTLRQVDGQGTVQSFTYLTNLGLNIFNTIYKFVKRNNLFGNSSVDRFFARFGFKSNPDTVVKLVEGSTTIDFNAVMSNSDTYNSVTQNGKRLGSYAGFGVGALNFKFNYKSDKFGYIIVLNWLQVIPMLVHGFHPQVLRKYPKDWFTPEYDGQTIRPIPMCEISQSKKTDLLTSNGDTKVYGFMNLYDDYRFLRDMVLGDFVTDKNTSQFVFARDMSYFRDHGSVKMAPQNRSIQYYDNNNNPDLTNPFQVSAQVADRFYLQASFDLSASRVAKSRAGALDLNGEGDLDIALGGNEMV